MAAQTLDIISYNKQFTVKPAVKYKNIGLYNA